MEKDERNRLIETLRAIRQQKLDQNKALEKIIHATDHLADDIPYEDCLTTLKHRKQRTKTKLS